MPVPAMAPLQPVEATHPVVQAPTALLCNAAGRVTRHQFVRMELRVEERERKYVPIFLCEDSGMERTYGCLRPTITIRELEGMFGKLQLERQSWSGCRRAWVSAVPGESQ